MCGSNFYELDVIFVGFRELLNSKVFLFNMWTLQLKMSYSICHNLVNVGYVNLSYLEKEETKNVKNYSKVQMFNYTLYNFNWVFHYYSRVNLHKAYFCEVPLSLILQDSLADLVDSTRRSLQR